MLFRGTTVTFINRNFLIRYKYEKSNKTNLIGAGRYSNLVGSEMANKHFSKVLESLEDKTIFKLRRGLKITFIAKYLVPARVV